MRKIGGSDGRQYPLRWFHPELQCVYAANNGSYSPGARRWIFSSDRQHRQEILATLRLPDSWHG